MRLGVDFSQWGGPLLPSTVACWKAQGVDHAVVQYSERMAQHLQVLGDAGGVEIEGYVYLYWGQSPWGQTPADRTRAALAAGRGRLLRLWLDAEDSTHPYAEDQLQECVEACQSAGVAAGIYTGRWWWEPATGNSQAFAHLPLWHAEYLAQGATPDLSRLPQDFESFRPYGGWTRPAIWQWWNTTAFCGHSVDLNAIPDNPQEDAMIRHNAIASWFDNRTIFGDQGMAARSDFGLPDEAQTVRLEIFVNIGTLRVYDGPASAYAGQVGWGGVNYGQIDVQLDDQGNLLLRADQPGTEISRIGCLGYWR